MRVWGWRAVFVFCGRGGVLVGRAEWKKRVGWPAYYSVGVGGGRECLGIDLRSDSNDQ